MSERPAPTADDVEPVENETLDRIATGTVTVLPFLALGVVGWQVWADLLGWSDLAVFAILYVAHRPRGHRRVPPPSDAPRVRDQQRRSAASLAVARLGRDRGPGDLLGGRPPQAPRLRRPARATRTAPTSATAAAGAARCAGSLHAHVGWLFIHTQRGAQGALRARPVARPRRAASSTARSSSGRSAGWPRRSGSAWRSAARVVAGLTGLLWGGGVRMFVAAPRHLQHQLALPLLRPPPVRHRRRVAQPRLARAAHRSARPGTTTITPSRPRPPTACAAGRSTSRRW